MVAVGFDDFKWAYNSVFHLCPMAVYVIDFEATPRRLEDVLERLRCVLGVVWKRLVVSWTCLEEFFAFL